VTVAVIGTGGLGSVIALHLASGGESLRLSSAGIESQQKLAKEIGPAAVVAADNHDVLQGAEAMVLALRFPVLKGVVEEIADSIGEKLVSRLTSSPVRSCTSMVGRLPATDWAAK
jgi:8-hydroxy-5-deazaflavin:NADPH oxidoreductase